MSIEHDLLTRMFEDDLQMARDLVRIRNFAMAAEALANATEKIHQIAALEKVHPVTQLHSVHTTPTIDV